MGTFDFWGKTQEDLDRDDVASAAARLRRSLERTMTELVSSLRGQVVFRADAQYELGELVDSVKSRHKTLLGLAASAANSRNDQAGRTLVTSLQTRRKSVSLLQAEESWPLNPAVHFNEWATFSKEDFTPVVSAWKEFLGLFGCDSLDCGSLLYVVRRDQDDDSLRCRCGAYNLNLQAR